MKKLIALATAAIAITTFADKATFPYDVSMTDRITTNETVTASDETVTLTGTITPVTDTVAELNMTAVTFTAIDSGDWAEFVDGLAGVAMLAIKDTEGTKAWYGYTGSSWVELTGPAIDLEATYNVKIQFDKTAGNKIGYSVNGTQLVDSGSNYWLAQGGSATQIAAIDLKGTGSTTAANLQSGARGAYANVTSIEQDYAFDYDNVKFKVVVGDGVYGQNAKIRVTLNDGVNNKSIDQTLNGAGTYTVDFSNQNLVKGASYNCTVQVVADDIASDDITDKTESQVKLFANADWFGFSAGAFSKATATGYEIEEGSFKPADEETPVVVTPTKASEANSRSTVEVTVDYTNYAETGDYDGAQSALALTSEGWKCLANGSWIAITNDNVSIANGSYSTRAEFDYTTTPSVKFSIYANSQWYVMESVADRTVKTFALAGDDTKLNGASFVGGGKVSAIAANFDCFGGIQPVIANNTITIESSADVNLDNLTAGNYTITQGNAKKKYPMKWTDATGKRAKMVEGQLVVEEQGAANGLESYHSYVLGLNTADPDSKPVLESVQNDSGTTLTLKVPNVNVNTDAADVTMELIEKASPSAADGTSHEFVGDTATVTIPDGVKYYEVRFTIKTK